MSYSVAKPTSFVANVLSPPQLQPARIKIGQKLPVRDSPEFTKPLKRPSTWLRLRFRCLSCRLPSELKHSHEQLLLDQSVEKSGHLQRQLRIGCQ